MSIWPHHPYNKFPDVVKKTHDAILYLALGPQDEIIYHYILHLVVGKDKEVVFDFPDACLKYYPDSNYPTHILIWMPSASHIFDYHEVNCVYTKED